jgi:hypothetical protein
LEQAGISFWEDQGQIKWGDSIARKINEGLRKSSYVIVIISDAFVSKQWPQAELDAAFNREMSDGKTHVLPLFVGDRNALTRMLPLLAGKRGLDWTGDPSHVVRELQEIEATIQSGDHLHAELAEQTSEGFSCQIYAGGNKKGFCQIWIGNDFGRHSHIYYSNSPQSFGGGSTSFNDMISVDESSGELRLKESVGNMFGERNEAATAAGVAENLWRRFIEN